MGNLIIICGGDCTDFMPPLIIFTSLLIGGCTAMFLIFGSLANYEITEPSFKVKATFLFSQISFKLGILILLMISFLIISLFICGLISIISGVNFVKKLFDKIKCKFVGVQKIHVVLFIGLFDIIYYFLYSSVSEFSTFYLITEFFTEPIYLLYIILYYRIFKKLNFEMKQIISSFFFFIIGIIVMVIGLSNYYCKSKINIKKDFWGERREYVCQDDISNYFYNYHISIIISIFIVPFLFFMKTLFAKK